MEVIALFHLVHFDQALIFAACEHLVASKSFSAAIKLCAIFHNLKWPFEEMVRSMAKSKNWTSAELLVRNASQSSTLSVL